MEKSQGEKAGAALRKLLDNINKTEQETLIKKTWGEFRDSGLLWWINMILHTFGWAIVAEIKEGNVVKVYPARVKYRGFDEKINTDGYIKVSRYLKENIEELLKESKQ